MKQIINGKLNFSLRDREEGIPNFFDAFIKRAVNCVYIIIIIILLIGRRALKFHLNEIFAREGNPGRPAGYFYNLI
jgi:hypothetical protein